MRGRAERLDVSNFLLGFVAGLCIIGGLAPVRSAAGQTVVAEQERRVVRGAAPPLGVPTGPTLEVEDEFECARR